MLFDKIDTDHLFSLVEADIRTTLKEIIQKIRDACIGIRFSELEKYANDRIDDSKKRYGKGGELLPYFGYFHPSEIISVITDNAKRGRLTRNMDRCPYVYNFDKNNRLIRIDLLPLSTTTICIRSDNIVAFLTYEKDKNGLEEIVNITFAKYNENGLLQALIMLQWWYEGFNKHIPKVYIEKYGKMQNNSRICLIEDIAAFNVDDLIRHCHKEEILVKYDENLKIVDWEWITSNDQYVFLLEYGKISSTNG